MIEANCPKCKQRRKFNGIDKNKYKCTSCNSILFKCKGKECNHMIGLGLYCNKCVGAGLKKGGSIVLTGTAIIAVGALKMLRGRK